MYRYKIFNQKTIISISLFIVTVLSINYFINPFNIFEQILFPKTFLKSDSKLQERLTKPIGFKIDKRKTDAIFIGSSRVDLCIDKNDYKLLTGKEAENLAIGGVYTDEITDMIELAKKIHPEIKNIYVGIDFESCVKNQNTNNNRIKITENPNLEVSELYTALLSAKTTCISFWSIFKNIFSIKKRTYYSSGVKNIFINKNISQEFTNTQNEYMPKYKTYNFDLSGFNKLSNYLKEQENINVKIFIMPTHITLQNLIYENQHTIKEYNLFKERLSENFDIYDFNYPNKYTKEEIKPDMIYFFDGSHATYNLSKLIIADILSENPTFARKITKNNVKEMNKLFVQELETYRGTDNAF